MGKSLVIVESPAKAKTINKYLGNDYIVKSSVGHVRDLPVSGSASKKAVDPKQRAQEAAKTRKMPPEEKAAYKKKKAHAALIDRMGIDPDNDWQAQYEILPGKEKVVKELVELARKADKIYLATDLDREGEAIAWHLREVIGGDDDNYLRVVFNEITQSAIQEAFLKPDQINIHRVEAQQTRRFLDRIVGYMVSPLLWAKIARGLSAGRVQSVAVRLLVEREREIRAFVPEEYWELFVQTSRSGHTDEQTFQVMKYADQPFKPKNQQESDAAIAALTDQTLSVTARDDRPTKTKPAAPFITSTLQQAASTRLSFSVKKTMMLAQRLYEAGHITYMRTDSTNLSQDALNQCRDFIQDRYGDAYLPEDPLRYGSKEGAQEAHEAIRPTNVLQHWSGLGDMEPDAQRLYELIWRRFVACQMTEARYLSTTIKIEVAQYELRLRGRILQFDGHLKAQPPHGSKGDEDQALPDIQVGEVLTRQAFLPKQHFTKPPARFSEAALVKELEKQGIGRPSTYASIISTIQDRGYAKVESRRFYAEKIGEIVTDRLSESFEELMDYNFTAEMEARLDEISKGSVGWREVLDQFYADFKIKLETAGEESAGMRPNDPVTTSIECPKCQRPMQIRNASTGVFLGCSGYALPPKERCKQTLNLLPGSDAVEVKQESDIDEELETQQLRDKRRCPLCGTAMESYLIDEQRKVHICGNNPDCEGYELEQGSFKIKGYDGPVLECDKCGSDMQLKSGRFGKYFGCTNDACSNTRKLLRNGEPAPPKADPIPMPHLRCEKTDDFFLLRDGAAGIFLAASQFPKHRETRAPFVDELQSIKEQLDPKLAYLAEAPQQDPEGNRTVIRYLRKTKEQYVMTENAEGKATGWRAFYQSGQWQASQAEAKKAKAPAKKKAAAKKKAPAKKKAAPKAKKTTAKKSTTKQQASAKKA